LASVGLTGVRKVYPGDIVAVHRSDLEIRDREFMVLVGPSGCGKTTTLRMIAGLEEITEGEIRIGDRVVNHILPRDRNIAMVFQNYAIYPHMTVYNNLAFGLRQRKVAGREIDRRVRDAAKVLGIEELLGRRPKALSGGQRQRVAVGRAIVREPAVFLFDEPLSNLDARMRVEMRKEIKLLHRRLQTTIIYVTHDQVEAMTLGDRICVMNEGHIDQVGPPIEVYDRPRTRFVAGFIGTPSMNFIRGRLAVEDGRGVFVSDDFRLALPERFNPVLGANSDREVELGIRPEDLRRNDSPSEVDTFIPGTVQIVEALGNEQLVYVSVGAATVVCRQDSHVRVTPGEEHAYVPAPDKMHLFDCDTGTRLAASVGRRSGGERSC